MASGADHVGEDLYIQAHVTPGYLSELISALFSAVVPELIGRVYRLIPETLREDWRLFLTFKFAAGALSLPAPFAASRLLETTQDIRSRQLRYGGACKRTGGKHMLRV